MTAAADRMDGIDATADRMDRITAAADRMDGIEATADRMDRITADGQDDGIVTRRRRP